MAEVFAGHSLGSHGFQKPVAIKRLLPELANDHVFVERLIGEAKLLVGMQHGNIVSVLDLARDGDDVFLVMEFVDGPSLRQLLKARGPRPLPLGVATYIVQSAAAGLEFAHARPGGAVIHADISPSNLLLTTSGEVRVADFGIARREGRLTGAVEGKWAYMAPEQARGESLTPGSDVFALGVVLYELITGQHPIGHRVTPDVRELEPVRVTPPRVVKPGVPAGLDAICMKALAHDPRDRYARMQHLIDALIDERFANGYREGANDLGQLIREMRPGAAPEVRTQVTDRPVTIMTRSLISSPARTSSPGLGSSSGEPAADGASLAGSRSAGSLPTDTLPTGPMPGVVPSAMPTVFARPAPLLSSGARTLELPGGIVPGPELASVHGGATITGTGHLDVRDARGPRWTLAVLGVAALVGVIAAVAIQLAPDAVADSKPPPARVAQAPIVIPIPTAPADPSATPAPAPAPAPGAAAAADPAATPAADPAAAPAADPAAAPAADRAAAPAPDPTPAPAIAHSHPSASHSDLAIRHARPAPPTRKSQEEAVLRVKTYDEQWVAAQIGSDLQYTPGAKFKLAAGSYTVRLKNDSYHGTCSVTLAPGQVRTLVVNMEEGACELR